MRRIDKRVDDAQAWEWLRRAPSVDVAAVLDGRPVLKTLHPVVLDGCIGFHGSSSGEKTAWDGVRVVLGCHEQVAEIPSTFQHPERACPATTWYRSAQFSGVMRTVSDLNRKAAYLQGLMERYQPDGGYVPIEATHPLYVSAVKNISVWELRPDQVSAKVAPGKKTQPAQRLQLAERLWERGHDGDDAAIEWVLHQERPPFLMGPADVVFALTPSHADLEQVVCLLEDTYWNEGIDSDRIRKAHLGSPVWVVGRIGARVVASARAVTDGHRVAFVADVVVDDAYRGQGIGRALMEVLLDHPMVRRANVSLHTRTAGAFYEQMGMLRGDGVEIWGVRRP